MTENHKKKLLEDAKSLKPEKASFALRELSRLGAREELYEIANSRKFLKYTPKTRRNAKNMLDGSELE